MLSTVIDKLTSLFSARMLVATFFPLLIVTFANMVLLRMTSAPFRAWLDAQKPEADLESVIQGAVVLVSIAVLASLVATLTTVLRELLEGKHWPKRLAAFFIPMEVERLKQFDAEREALQAEYWKVRGASGWPEDLRKARATGKELGSGSFAGLSAAAVRAMDSLTAASKKGELSPFVDLQAVKVELEVALARYKTSENTALDRLQKRFKDMLDYATARIDVELTDHYTRRSVRFGDRYTAPTSIGNIAAALSSYALSRYGLSIDILWTRMQKVLQSDQEYYEVVQDAKAQLDGIVLLFWLTAGTALFWLIRLAFTGYSLGLFLSVAAAGPLICAGLYLLAATSYLAFADLLRSVTDLYRFALLEKLHLPLPQNAGEEQIAWDRVNRWIGFGEMPDQTYEHKQ